MLIIDHKDIKDEKKQSLGETIILVLVFINVLILRFAFVTDEKSYKLLLLTLPMLLVSVIYHIQHKHIIHQRQPAGNGPAEV